MAFGQGVAELARLCVWGIGNNTAETVTGSIRLPTLRFKAGEHAPARDPQPAKHPLSCWAVLAPSVALAEGDESSTDVAAGEQLHPYKTQG